MTHRTVPAAALAAVFSFVSPSLAQDLGGGGPAGHGRVPRFVLDSWIPGTSAQLGFVDLSPSFANGAAILSGVQTSLTIPGISGSLLVDPSAGAVLPMGATPITVNVPLGVSHQDLYLQAVVIDSVSGFSFTDATRARFLNPVVMVGNQRQTANSISVIDIVSRQVTQRLGDSENGSIAFSPDRTRCYVCEPGSLRDRVVVYDLTVNPIAVITTVSTSGGIRYRGEFSPDGRRLYVPVHDGVDIVDTFPASPTYHTLVGKIPTPITGNPNSIFTGPIDVAVTPDGTKLFIAFGENLSGFPAPSTVGVVDLLVPGFPYRAIPVTTGGVVTLLNNLATRAAIRISPDGRYAYTVEFGFNPGPFAIGFTNGGLLNVVDVLLEQEVAAIPTGGYGQSTLEIDFLGRNLYVPQVTLSGIGEVLRVDVDRRSATRNAIRSRIQVDPTPYSASTGPSSVAVTADGRTVLVTLSEDAAHPVPQLITIDARTDTIVGLPIVVESLPGTVACQR